MKISIRGVKRAFDLIYEHRPDQQAEIREILEGIIGQASELVMDHCSKSYIRFAAPEWDRTSLKSGLGNLYAEPNE